VITRPRMEEGRTQSESKAHRPTEFDCDLIVVGLGPVGDVLAALAKLRGLSVIAIDRDQAVFPLPRAAVFDHEIMRIFQMIGITERIMPLCRVPDRYQFLTAQRQVLLDFPIATEGPFGWAETYALHQPAVEQTLRERLTELAVDVRTDCRLLALEQDDQGVDVRVQAADNKSESILRARYVVGCDGASSTVRTCIGSGLDDYEFDEPWLVLDTIIDPSGDLPIVCQQICDPERPVTHLAMSGKRFRWEFMIKPGESAEDFLEHGRIRELLAPWNCADRLTIERAAVYRFHGLIAKQWRSHRVFLAGDAAHQMPPFAGQGMCSGIRDVANLAWKLSAVLREGAGEAILNSYQTEREPHVRAIIETAIQMGRIVCMLDAEAAAGRDAQMLARRQSGAQDVSVKYPDLMVGLLSEGPLSGALFPQPVRQGVRFDDLLGEHATLIGRDLPGVQSNVRMLDLAKGPSNAFKPFLESWLRDVGTDAVLIRPDRHIFGTGPASDLLTKWNDALGELSMDKPRPVTAMGPVVMDESPEGGLTADAGG
jgi:3-(3-hydroxy-phenyl)propionate hydroxylase